MNRKKIEMCFQDLYEKFGSKFSQGMNGEEWVIAEKWQKDFRQSLSRSNNYLYVNLSNDKFNSARRMINQYQSMIEAVSFNLNKGFVNLANKLDISQHIMGEAMYDYFDIRPFVSMEGTKFDERKQTYINDYSNWDKYRNLTDKFVKDTIYPGYYFAGENQIITKEVINLKSQEELEPVKIETGYKLPRKLRAELQYKKYLQFNT